MRPRSWRCRAWRRTCPTTTCGKSSGWSGALLELAEEVTPADDSKLTRLRGWLEGFRAGQRGERVIVFTEYRDTLDYLEAEPRHRAAAAGGRHGAAGPAHGRSWRNSRARRARCCWPPTPPGRA